MSANTGQLIPVNEINPAGDPRIIREDNLLNDPDPLKVVQRFQSAPRDRTRVSQLHHRVYGMAVDPPRERDLLCLFLVVVLVDADLIDPHEDGVATLAELTEGDLEGEGDDGPASGEGSSEADCDGCRVI